ncbi:MAG TPA: hypothetical protein VNU93_06110, partial [Verrucomicrobiae bacterium]|nr:hypothetical protein [Verrucomicrobiae bacterium]
QEITGLEPLIPSLGETFEWTSEGITRIPGESGIWQVQKPVEAGMERETNETGGPGPQEYAPREHGRREHGSQGQNARERVTQGQVDKALLSLRSKLNQLVDLSRKDNDLPAALTSIKEISAWVDIKLSLRKGK